MTKTLEVPLEDLREWLEQETLSLIEQFKAEVTNLLNDIRNKVDDIEEICEKLLDASEREMLKSNPKTYRRAREMYRLAQKVLETIDKVTIPDEVSYETFQTLCEDFEKMLSAVGLERAKRFPRISPYFFWGCRRLDMALRNTVSSFDELRFISSDEYAKVKDVEDAFSMIDKLLQTLDELGTVEERKKQMELRREALKKKITEDKRKIMLIKKKGEVAELDQINKKIKELEEKVKYNLRHLQKPFLKFQRLARGPSYSLSLSETKKLSEYLSNPFMALVTEDEECQLLKRILQKTEDAITQGKIKLKSSRLRKAQKQIDDILQKATLTPLYQSCKETFSQRQRLLMSETIVTYQNKLKHFQKRLKKLPKKKELMDSRSTVLESEHRKIVEKIENQKRELEKIVLELTNKNVRVTW